MGLTISPLVNTDRKGGASPIMLQQFKRAIGVAIVSGNARHKLGRLHYVRSRQQTKQHTPAGQATVYIGGEQIKMDGQPGSRSMSRKGTLLLDNFGMGMTFACIRCGRCHQPKQPNPQLCIIMCSNFLIT